MQTVTTHIQVFFSLIAFLDYIHCRFARQGYLDFCESYDNTKPMTSLRLIFSANKLDSLVSIKPDRNVFQRVAPTLKDVLVYGLKGELKCSCISSLLPFLDLTSSLGKCWCLMTCLLGI